MIWWLVLIGVLIASAILGGIYANRARETGEVERFRVAMGELEAEVGKALLPPLHAMLVRLNSWLERHKD